MNTEDAIIARRAIKHYDPNFTIPASDEERLWHLIRQTPTSFNMQNWRLVVVRDKDLRAKIQAAAWNQSQVTEASLLCIVCADLNAWDKSPERYWEKAPEAVQKALVPYIRPFYQDKPQLQRDEAMRSIGLVSQTLMLAAKSMGYDSCPMVGFDPAKVGQLIQLPQDHAIGMMVVIGKAAEPAHPKPGYLPQGELIRTDRF